jgi:DNA-binding beta-propeller fold protein YncE
VLALGSLSVLPIGGAYAQALTPAEATAGSSTVHHYEYVFPGGEMYVYDMDNNQQLVQHVTLPDGGGVRGVIVDPATHRLYISYGGDGPTGSFNGSLLAYDLVSETVLWNRAYAFPIDSGAITPDGKTIYMPSGENDPSGAWNVLSASNGELIESISAGAKGAHNTIVSLDGKYVFMGGRDYNYLVVVSTATNKVVQKIGPLIAGVRPFTVNGADTLAYTTETEFLGFQVSSIRTGKVLYTVEFPGLSAPYPFAFSAPSHGITLTPDEKQLYVFDAVHETVHVFDVSGVPAGPPVSLAEIKLSSIEGEQSPCDYDCMKSGWLQASRDGRFVYVGDSGDVLDTHTLKIATNLPPLVQTRELLETDWSDGVPVATTSRYGLGYVMGSSGEPPATEPPIEPPVIEPPREPPATEPPHRPPATEAHSQTPSSWPAAPPMQAASPPGFASRLAGEPIGATAQIRDLDLTSAVFKVGVGVTISYTDPLPGRATFTVLRALSGVESTQHRCVTAARRGRAAVGRRCTRYVLLGSFIHGDQSGRNSFRFSGRVDGRRLKLGRYRLQVLPTFGGRAGVQRTTTFRIIG